jgi:hypothetical protein
MVTRYDFDGVNLDRVRFPASDWCYCSWCKERFRTDTGTVLTAFDSGTSEALAFLEWKRRINLKAAETICRAIRDARPGMPITAYVVAPDDKDDKAQSWELWVRNGLVDAVAVSMYERNISKPAEQARLLLRGHENRLLCAIRCDFEDRSIYLRNLAASRVVSPLGQFTWHAGTLPDDLSAISEGPYRLPASPPWKSATPPQ